MRIGTSEEDERRRQRVEEKAEVLQVARIIEGREPGWLRGKERPAEVTAQRESEYQHIAELIESVMRRIIGRTCPALNAACDRREEGLSSLHRQARVVPDRQREQGVPSRHVDQAIANAAVY